MIRLSILLTEQHRLLSVAAMLDVFATASRFYQEENQEELFQISLLRSKTSAGPAYSTFPVYIVDDAPKMDMILIPAFDTENIEQAVHSNKNCIEWLNTQYNKGVEIASFCTGAFLLAATGLLDNKAATTHIQSAAQLSRSFPMIQLQSREIMTFDKGISTSGGATNSFYLMLRLIERYAGKPLAIRTAKYFAIDMDREHQIYFSSFKPVRDHQDELVTTLQNRIEQDFAETTTVEGLLAEIPSSRRNLVRRFKGATGLTPIEYLQRTRIEAAKKMLEESDKNINEVMMEVGYNDVKAFRILFRKNTGLTPTQYREKFSSVRSFAIAS